MKMGIGETDFKSPSVLSLLAQRVVTRKVRVHRVWRAVKATVKFVVGSRIMYTKRTHTQRNEPVNHGKKTICKWLFDTA